MLVTLDGQRIDYGKLLPYVDQHLFWVTAFVIPFHRWGRDSMNIIIFIECLWSIELSACGMINIETFKKNFGIAWNLYTTSETLKESERIFQWKCWRNCLGI